jgi:hypothetical protein
MRSSSSVGVAGAPSVMARTETGSSGASNESWGGLSADIRACLCEMRHRGFREALFCPVGWIDRHLGGSEVVISSVRVAGGPYSSNLALPIVLSRLTSAPTAPTLASTQLRATAGAPSS